VRVIATSTLKAFWEQSAHRSAEAPMRAWLTILKAARWPNPMDVKTTFNSADLLADGRVVFDIGGNKWRVVAKLNDRHQVLYIRFVGTHAQYDRVDANTV
jgi:mRNA interferase HigB